MATIEIKPDRYILGVWFVGNGKKDWICYAYRDKGQTLWQIRYRFRYYKGRDPWDHKDKKSHYQATFTGSEQELVKQLHTMASFISSEFGEVSFVPMYSDDADQNSQLLMKQPWAHAKTMSRDEAKRQGLL